MTINTDIIEGNWKQLRGKVQQKWGELTDDTLDQIAGSRDQLLGKIQESYGKTREEAERELKTWEDEQRNSSVN